MKIAIISTCSRPLSEEQFVRPLTEIASPFGKPDILYSYAPGYDRYIISGTAMQDFSYLSRLEEFRPLQHEAVLGICAGWQIMLGLENARHEPLSIAGKREIEFINGRKEEAYFLFSRYYRPEGWEVLATMDTLPVLASKGSISISLFHPEVLNRWIIKRFIENGKIQL